MKWKSVNLLVLSLNILYTSLPSYCSMLKIDDEEYRIINTRISAAAPKGYDAACQIICSTPDEKSKKKFSGALATIDSHNFIITTALIEAYETKKVLFNGYRNNLYNVKKVTLINQDIALIFLEDYPNGIVPFIFSETLGPCQGPSLCTLAGYGGIIKEFTRGLWVQQANKSDERSLITITLDSLESRKPESDLPLTATFGTVLPNAMNLESPLCRGFEGGALLNGFRQVIGVGSDLDRLLWNKSEFSKDHPLLAEVLSTPPKSYWGRTLISLGVPALEGAALYFLGQATLDPNALLLYTVTGLATYGFTSLRPMLDDIAVPKGSVSYFSPTIPYLEKIKQKAHEYYESSKLVTSVFTRQ